MSGIKDRLLEFLGYLDIGQTNFEKNTGLSNGLINNLKNDISSKSLVKILYKHPELNIEWLLIGKGEKLKYNDAEKELLLKQRIEDLVTIQNLKDKTAALEKELIEKVKKRSPKNVTSPLKNTKQR